MKFIKYKDLPLINLEKVISISKDNNEGSWQTCGDYNYSEYEDNKKMYSIEFDFGHDSDNGYTYRKWKFTGKDKKSERDELYEKVLKMVGVVELFD